MDVMDRVYISVRIGFLLLSSLPQFCTCLIYKYPFLTLISPSDAFVKSWVLKNRTKGVC